MENDFLRVVVDSVASTFQIEDRRTGRDFIRNAFFPHPVSEISSATTVADPRWGQGKEILLRHTGGWTTRLTLFRGQPFLHVHTTVHNRGEQTIAESALQLLEFQIDLDRPLDRLKSFGTGFLHPLDKAPGSFTFTAVVDPESRNGALAACLTHERGSGVFFTDVTAEKVRIKARVDCGRYQVLAGQSRPTETLLLGYFDDARLGLEAYADAVARHYAIRLPPQPSVYCTWYHAGASDEKKILENSRFVRTQLKPFGMSVMQIDDHWQKRIPAGIRHNGSEQELRDGGPIKVFVEANDKYPSGMRFTAEEIDKLGLVPGIWFMPFAGNWKNPYFADRQDLFARWPDGTPITTRWSGTLLDLSNPRTQTFVRERVKRVADWGYRYFKLDGMHTGAVTHNVYVNTGYATDGRWLNSRNFVGDQQAQPGSVDQPAASNVLHDPTMTHIEAYRTGLQIVRQAAGPKVFILGCNVSQNMRSMGAAFGLIDAMRIGPDNGAAGRGRWDHVTVGARHGSNLYFLNRRVWHNDPDPVYVRPSLPLDAARLMVSWVAVTGSMLSTSYQFAELPAERLDLLKRCMPSHTVTARPVDLFEADPPRIWLATQEQKGARRGVIGLFNWDQHQPREFHRDLSELGLDVEETYVAFDYWANEMRPPIQETLRHAVPAGSCTILAVRPQADHPQLLSTSRHITQGLVDVLEERWDASTKTLHGRSRVVGGDPYELRIALPTRGNWTPASAAADTATINVDSADQQLIRLRIDSRGDREVAWQLVFQNS